MKVPVCMTNFWGHGACCPHRFHAVTAELGSLGRKHVVRDLENIYNLTLQRRSLLTSPSVIKYSLPLYPKTSVRHNAEIQQALKGMAINIIVKDGFHIFKWLEK